MKILGLHINTGQTAAALIDNGRVRSAATEERFDRIKQSRNFPRRAIDFCLKDVGLNNIEELDGIAISWNPAENMRNINLSGFTEWRRYDPEWLYIVTNNLMSQAGRDAFKSDILKLEIGIKVKCPIYFVKHHHSHLAHAVCQSSFKRGLAAIVDEYGEFNSVTIAAFNGNNLNIIKEIAYPNSLGVFYATFTEYLGFTPNADEWKVMGAAAYGDSNRFSKKLEKIFLWDDKQGEWILDTRFIEHANMKRAGYINEHLVDLIGIPVRTTSEKLLKQHFDLAASIQYVFEKRLMQLLLFYAKRTKESNLAVSGGCFMNAVANGKIISNTQFKNIFIPYAAADNGGAMGAALYVWHYYLNKKRNILSLSPSPFLGPSYSNQDVEVIIKKNKLKSKKVNNIAKYAALEISNGKLVGWFQGRMEFGERALGNRSILADPRDIRMKDKINSAVKFRESFRPFAPSILAEKAPQFFDMPKNIFVPYMDQACLVKTAVREKIPAVVHIDGTSRLQMVSKKMNPLFYELICQFEKITSIPLVLNTSFNINGEPIVCSPADAIRTFYSCGLDILIIDNFVIEK